jgi:uncharacterized protein YidB (DUF937 family)
MSLLNEILKEVGGNTLTSEHHSMLFDTVVGMITNPQSGGLQGLLESFKKKGLGDIFSSWISTGKNLPVSPGQVQQVFGQAQIQQIAQKLGLDPSQVSEGLSKLMPAVVDKLTPKGDIPVEDLLGGGLNALKKLFGI